MQKSSKAETRRSLLVSLFVLGLVAAVLIVPFQFRSEAGSQKGKGAAGNPERFENYDIRDDKSDDVQNKLVSFRQESGKSASAVADVRDKFAHGEEALRQTVPSLKVEYNRDIRIPEVITPDVWKQKVSFLTGPTSGSRSEVLRNFVKQNNDLVGITDQQASGLKVIADYTNPDGNLSYVQFDQVINDIPVFRGEIKAGFTKQGEIIRVINNLAPGVDYASAPTEFGDPMNAVKAAAASVKYTLTDAENVYNKAKSTKTKAIFGEGEYPIQAEKFYFPTEPGVVRAAWRVQVWVEETAYMFQVDAQTGTILWRKNLGESQTQSVTYNVYANPNSISGILSSPAPLVPGLTDPTLGTQGTLVARTNVSLIGNEPPYAFNNTGWIPDGGNTTEGNNVQAGLDRVSPNGIDGVVTGSGSRVFNFTYTPSNGNAGAGDDPLTTAYQNGIVTHLFFVTNRYHDELYRYGFTEPAFNFQQDNFGRGGTGGDRISAQAQDFGGFNNANFGSPAGTVVGPDGGIGVMQMFLWNGPTPDRDGDLDADVIIHELTHGTSSRLHGNTAGITNNMTRGMGEGWGDFYAHVMLANPTDSINNIYSEGGYATMQFGSGTFFANHYYGIRRWPKAPIAATGGPNNRPFNPMTFKYVNSNCDTFIGTTATTTTAAYPRSPVIATSGSCDQVHNAGEIWASALWEVRTRMVTRLGFSVGSHRTLQLVTDGMKLAPLNPTFLQERDAIIAAAAAAPLTPEASADVTDVREGFRVRGMGFSASVQSTTSGSTAVTEAFDQANVSMTNPFAVSDSPGDNDGFPEPGENLLLSIAVTNATGGTINNVQVNVTGGGTVNYGNINDGQTVTNQVPYTVPNGATCGSMHQVTINVSSAIGSQTPVVREFRLGAPVGGAPVSFTNSTVINVPNGQPTTTSGSASPYPSTINVAGLSGQKIMKLTFNNFHHEFEDDVDMLLVGPAGQKLIFLSDVGGTTEQLTPITFSVADNGPTLLPDAAGFVNGTTYKPSNVGANDAFAAPAPGTPYDNAAPGGAATFASTFGTDGATLNGTWSLYIVDDAGQDPGAIDGGWTLTFESDAYFCQTSPKSRADFDGDGKSDVSVFRSSDATWYLNRSTAGFSAVKWGLSTDTLIPGDYDGDGKADLAVYRPTAVVTDADIFILNSNGNTLSAFAWGNPGDVPVFADYDGDNKTDYAVFRPSDNTWYVFGSTIGNSFLTFGQAGDIPVAGDFDGDGKADRTVYRGAGQWITVKSTGGMGGDIFGLATDKLVPADYDGDGKDDYAVFRSGTWHYKRSIDGVVVSVPWGLSTDILVPGDYDGDGKDDQAVYRDGTWYMNRSTAGFASAVFGLSSDKPVAKAYIP